ncbi:MAG: GNAT family N-acetyltransferase [Smithella sp.]|jgi:GNAT superfamily N-acetyltransferase
MANYNYDIFHFKGKRSYVSLMIKPLVEDIKEALSIMNELIIAQAVKKDLPIILDIQRKAFMEVARSFNLKSLPPIEQTLESLTDEFVNSKILKASIANTIIGSVRAYRKNDTCHIGKLVVLPEYQNKGIGKALMNEIENQYKSIVKRYELFTGARDPRNRYLYNQLGYKSFKTEKLNDEISFVYMEKSAQ